MTSFRFFIDWHTARRSTQAGAMFVVVSTLSCERDAPRPEAVGTLEMVEVGVGPLQPSRVARVLVNEGDMVHAGDTLAVLVLPTLAASEDQALARASAARQ